MICKKLFVFLTLALLLTPSTFAQFPSTQQPEEDQRRQTAQTALTNKGIELIGEITSEARALRLPENRAFIQAAAADLLWNYDEQAARSLFGAALSSLGEIAVGLAQDDPSRVELEQFAGELRAEVLDKVARHDLSWARELLRSTPNSAGQANDELELYLTSALHTAARDPLQAARIAAESLNKGYSTQLLDLVARLRERDTASAAELSGAIVTKLRGQNLAANEEAANVAVGLLHLIAEPRSIPAKATKDSVARSVLDQQHSLALVEMLTSAVHDTSATNLNLLLSLLSLLPEIERHAPAHAALLRRKLAQAGHLPQQQTNARSEPLSQNVSPQELPQTAPAETRDELYSEAAATAQNAGDSGGARQLAGHIADPKQRREMLSLITRQELLNTARAGKAEQTLSAIATLPANEERITILIELAVALSRKNELKRAEELLNEARTLLRNRARNFAQINTRLRLACALAMVDPEQGFEVIGTIVNQLDALAAATVVVAGFTAEEQLTREDELRLISITQFLGAGANESDPDEPLASLARTDFERMKIAADRFQHPELRALAHLLLARVVLSKQATN